MALRSGPGQTAIFTALALVAFAANSVLCRLALGTGAIDAASFTVLRLLSGALVLSALVRWRPGVSPPSQSGSRGAALALFIYAVCFSFAYLELDTGTGALILFASVQLCLVAASLRGGHRPRPGQWGGLVLSLAGFLYLILPGAQAPSLSGLLLMLLAGAAWAAYTLIGRGSRSPLRDTASSFTRTLPLAALLALGQLLFSSPQIGAQGLVLAIASGALASGLGYAIWYRALSGLDSLQAGVVQLAVPVLAAGGGMLFLSETLGVRLLLSAAMILGGIALVFLGRGSYRCPAAVK